MGPVPGPHARTDRSRDTRVAEPRLPTPEDGRPGEGQRLTPDAPHNGGRPPSRGWLTTNPAACSPQGTQAKGTVLGPHTHTGVPTAPSQVGENRDRTPPPPSTPDGARDRGRTRGGARTTWNGPTSAQCRDLARCARHTTQGGGERTPPERKRTHTQRARGDYQKANRTELAERTDRVEWCTSERGYSTPGQGGSATRSAAHAGREGGNGRDTTPGTGPSPSNRSRAPRTHGRGTAPASVVVAHCATPQPLG